MLVYKIKKVYYKLMSKIHQKKYLPKYYKNKERLKDLKVYKKEKEIFINTPYTDIEKLSESYRHLLSVFYYDQNKYYQDEFILKNYAQIAPFKTLNATIEHGPYLGDDYAWENDINNEAKAIITFSKYREEVLKRHTGKDIIPIGPYIHYAQSYLSEEEKKKEKKRLGKNLLVFPTHCTHWNIPEFDTRYFISEIEKLKKDFDSVRVCMYWKDIEKKMHLPYINAGYECVTAGFMFSSFFFSRLKNIIELSDLTVGNSIGTNVGYSIFFNKPYYHINMPVKQTYDPKISTIDEEQRQMILRSCNTGLNNIKKLEDLFSSYTDKITEEQREKIDYYWGTSLVKTPEELAEILDKYLF